MQRVKEEEGEGCNIYGFLEVNKVAGSFHFVPGKSFHQSASLLQDLLVFQSDSYNVSQEPFSLWQSTTYYDMSDTLYLTCTDKPQG